MLYGVAMGLSAAAFKISPARFFGRAHLGTQRRLECLVRVRVRVRARVRVRVSVSVRVRVRS